ncbi:tripartite ATP-independent transporter DctP family solute receptor [Caldalkalibacillus uzonensis]|uniref:Tripartite ATP-independent transporter DctP family solute receptor n=1 Tax=Caldalkalibacillus uzonensis TaxID=353224 RepID=A0ABU0CPF0_9BACI|nr:TRAP transporter substrate-binding protein [Caldalkalibacillus uzonensis]MDQ0338288.1 tripartite ATP-independent transporter DctP family solute receptor [Caldalkalibacillus uzonensis]
MKKTFLIFGMLVLVLALAACGGDSGTSSNGEAEQEEEQSAPAGETIRIDIASVYEEKSAPAKGAAKFAELVNERSNGEIEVNFFPNGALGTERENFEAVRAGDLEMVLGGYQGVDMYAPEYMFFTAPFLFQSMEHMQAALYGDLGEQMFAEMADAGLQIIGTNIRGARHMTANKPIETPDDVKGLNLRLPEIEAWIASWEAIGASPTPVALPELYGALQTGVVEASEGPYEQIYTFKLQEVQDYLINTGHIYEATFMWMNKDLWDSLSPEHQQLIQEAAEEAMAYADAEAVSDAEQFYQELQEAGMQVVEIDKEAFVEQAQPGLERFFQESWTVTSLEEINALLD